MVLLVVSGRRRRSYCCTSVVRRISDAGDLENKKKRIQIFEKLEN